MASPLASRLDSIIGDGVEGAVRARHRVRLRRLGWERALDPPGAELWARDEPPPREGCSMSVRIDGAEALPEIAAAIADGRARPRPIDCSSCPACRDARAGCWDRLRG